jgi:hypothetical protein
VGGVDESSAEVISSRSSSLTASELGKGDVAAEQTTDVAEVLVEPSDEIEGQRAIGDIFPEIAESSSPCP